MGDSGETCEEVSQAMAAVQERIRIGVLARRTDVSTHLLRVWEERYDLLRPTRTPGGYRLYGPQDEERIRAVLALRATGLATAEAARVVLARAGRSAAAVPLPEIALRLYPALTRFEEDRARGLLDQAFEGHPLPEVLRGLVFPILRRLGDEWESGRISIAHEHYASGMLRERLVALADRPQDGGSRPATGGGPLAVLACPSFERHDIPLVAFDLLLRAAGWRVRRLGADTPVPAAVAVARAGRARLLVLAGIEPQMFAAQLEQHAADLADLADLPYTCRLALAGPAATPALAARYRAEHLVGDPQAAVESLSAGVTGVGQTAKR